MRIKKAGRNDRPFLYFVPKQRSPSVCRRALSEFIPRRLDHSEVRVAAPVYNAVPVCFSIEEHVKLWSRYCICSAAASTDIGSMLNRLIRTRSPVGATTSSPSSGRVRQPTGPPRRSRRRGMPGLAFTSIGMGPSIGSAGGPMHRQWHLPLFSRFQPSAAHATDPRQC